MTTQTTNSIGSNVGWIGLGRMGEAMVKRLLAGGYKATAWNRTASKAEPLVAYGASIAASKQDLASCEVVFTMVSTTDDLKEVLFGEGGLTTGKLLPKRASPRLENRAQRDVWRGDSKPVRDHRDGRKGGHSAPRVFGVDQRLGAGQHVHALQNARAHQFRFDHVTFTPKLLLKDMDLGMASAKTYGVDMPAAAATRESVARMVARSALEGHEDVDFSIMLLETAKDAGMMLVSENKAIDDGLQAK